MNHLGRYKSIDKIVAVWTSFFNDEVFYVPALGFVYPSDNSVKKFLIDVLKNSETNRFLPYDGNKRWFQKKTEKIILSAIVANDKEIYIPVKDSFKNVLKIFYYSKKSLNNTTLTKVKKIYIKIKNAQRVDNLRLQCFKKPKIKTEFICHNIYLKNITPSDNLVKSSKEIHYYNELSSKTQSTFSNLGKGSELEGFDFLWKEFIIKNKKLNPIICATSKKRIVGAIGPLDILNDAWGVPFLLPPYFGVADKMRRMGIGKKLWKAAMNFAYQKGVKYTLVQNISNSPAARFYKKQGLSNMGKIYSRLLIK
ncbi:MAG: GNAT family N-acetyltransferase [bacterium]|nr:GNAT family N-acetyltransferase [bacterium]